MNAVALGARLLLALVFAVAAASKLADQEGTVRTMGDFRVPVPLRRVCAALLPLAELATAYALVIGPSARAGAIAALVLLVVFAAGIGTAMIRGEAPDCHCFGQVSSTPAGPATLVRNLALAVPAVLVLLHGAGASPGGWLRSTGAANWTAAIGCVAAACLGVACLNLWRERRRLEDRLERQTKATAAFPPGLPVGARAPGFELRELGGATVSLDDVLGRQRPVALAFVSADCGPCVAMLRDLASWQHSLSDRLSIVLLAQGVEKQIRELVTGLDLRQVLLDSDARVFESYRGNGTPSVVIVGPDGLIATELRSTHTIIETVIRRGLSSGAIPAPGEAAGPPVLPIHEASRGAPMAHARPR